MITTASSSETDANASVWKIDEANCRMELDREKEYANFANRGERFRQFNRTDMAVATAYARMFGTTDNAETEEKRAIRPSRLEKPCSKQV